MTCNTVRGFFLSVSLCVTAGNNAAAWHTALTHRTHNSITSNLLQEPMFFYYPDLKKFHANIEDGSNTGGPDLIKNRLGVRYCGRRGGLFCQTMSPPGEPETAKNKR